jgi:hypothetical protein
MVLRQPATQAEFFAKAIAAQIGIGESAVSREAASPSSSDPINKGRSASTPSSPTGSQQ